MMLMVQDGGCSQAYLCCASDILRRLDEHEFLDMFVNSPVFKFKSNKGTKLNVVWQTHD